MYRIVFNKFLVPCAFALLAGCAALTQYLPVFEEESVESQRATVAMSSLATLGEPDAYIKLGNEMLGEQVRAGLLAQDAAAGAYRFARLNVRFARQVITLSALVEITDAAGHTLTTAVQGDVILTYSGNQLIWLPQFNELQVRNKDFFFEGAVYLEASEDLRTDLLRRVNRDIADAVIVLGRNTVRINALPLGQVEVGVTLTSLGGTAATRSHVLGGVFTVAASAILVEPGQTSIALDLEFIPNISPCSADVRVSRSAFAREVSEHEPVGIVRFLDNGPAENHFFTEIEGATRPTQVVHYWFADGQPVALEELPVEPSQRWRTWSSHLIDPGRARNWEVIVVEKESGCILHSQAIGAGFSAGLPPPPGPMPEVTTFEQYRAAFEKRLGAFSILGQRPGVALIEIARPFLRDSLHDSLKDLQIVVSLDVGDQPRQSLSGSLRPLNAGDIVCAARECTASRECSHGYSQCTRLRDNRDCSTCLFRNPLNNRCINEGTDPICEAARATQNAKFEAAREACVEQETIAATECAKLVAQELRSCEIEAASEQSVCEGAREAVTAFSAAESFAAIDLDLQAGGRLNAIFSDMQIEGDLQGLRLNLGFNAALNLQGDVRFTPAPALGPLAECMAAWKKTFSARVVFPQLASSMITDIQASPGMLSAPWSGYVVPAAINPSPLGAMFAGNPNLLADCRIGLTAAKVVDAIGGPGRMYLAGTYPLEIRPAATRIVLGRATVEYGERSFDASPQLGVSHLRYELR